MITGLNGSGKSQLLQAIAMQWNSELRRFSGGTADLSLKIDGIAPKPHEVFFLQDFAKPLNSALSSVAYLEERIREYKGGGDRSDVYENQIAGVVRNPAATFTYANLHEVFYYNPQMLERAVAHHFIAYKIHRAITAEHLYDTADRDTDISMLVGKAPWDDLNEWFATGEFPYRLEPPTGIEPSATHFRLHMRHTKTDDIVALADLSSGEASIVRFLFMIFAASKTFSGSNYCCWTNRILIYMLA